MDSNYYHDICFPYTTKKKTDIILNDRQKIFKDENLTLCQE